MLCDNSKYNNEDWVKFLQPHACNNQFYWSLNQHYNEGCHLKNSTILGSAGLTMFD